MKKGTELKGKIGHVNIDEIDDLLIEFDEVGYEPTTLCVNPQAQVESFRYRLKKALTELKQIKEAKPSEAMDKLEGLGFGLWNEDKSIVSINGHYFKNAYDTIKQALLKAQELEKENAEYKEVLRIIKEKPQAELALIQLGKIKTYEEYLDRTQHWDGIYWDMIYTQEEFDLLKRWKNES